MNRMMSIVGALFAGALLAVPFAGAHAAAPQQTPNGRVGTVNIGAIFRDLTIRPVAEADTRLQAFVNDRQGQLNTLESSIESQRSAVTAAPEGSVMREEAQRTLARMTAEYQVNAQIFEREIQLHSARVHLDLYDLVRAAIATVARDQGLDLVLRSDEMQSEQGEEPDLQDLLRQMRDRVALYTSPGTDITQLVVSQLNR